MERRAGIGGAGERKKGRKVARWEKEGTKRRECHPDTTITYPPLSSSTSRPPLSLISFRAPLFSLSQYFHPAPYTHNTRPLIFIFSFVIPSSSLATREKSSPCILPSFSIYVPTSLPSFPVLQFRGFVRTLRFVSFEKKKKERERKKKGDRKRLFSRYAINEKEGKEKRGEKESIHRFLLPHHHCPLYLMAAIHSRNR